MIEPCLIKRIGSVRFRLDNILLKVGFSLVSHIAISVTPSTLTGIPTPPPLTLLELSNRFGFATCRACPFARRIDSVGQGNLPLTCCADIATTIRPVRVLTKRGNRPDLATSAARLYTHATYCLAPTSVNPNGATALPLMSLTDTVAPRPLPRHTDTAVMVQFVATTSCSP